MKQYPLDNVKQAFLSWRALRSGRCSTPDYLKERAISLLSRHTRKEICEALKINHRALKSWQAELQQEDANAFISLPVDPVLAVSSAADVVLKIKTPSGLECELSGDVNADFIAQTISALHAGGPQ